MKRMLAAAAALGAALLLGSSASGSSAGGKVVLGYVDYVDGKVTLTRNGAVTKGMKVDDPVYNLDKLQTDKGASVEIAFEKASGITGTLKLKPSTVVSIDATALKAGTKAGIDLAAGGVAVKEKLASGTSFSVTTSSAAMGVRGTTFNVSCSVNGNVLVDCDEGEVSCAPVDPLSGAEDPSKAVSAAPGAVIEARDGEPIKKAAVTVAGLAKFRDDWLKGEEALFRGNPVKTLRMLEERYRAKAGEFKAAFSALYASAVFKTWKDEDRAGKFSDRMAMLKQKKEMFPLMARMGRVAFIFQRLFYRIADVEPYVTPAMGKLELRKGYSVADFLREFDKDKAKLEEALAIFAYVRRLYIDRGSDEDFLGSDGPLSGSGLMGGGSASGLLGGGSASSLVGGDE